MCSADSACCWDSCCGATSASPSAAPPISRTPVTTRSPAHTAKLSLSESLRAVWSTPTAIMLMGAFVCANFVAVVLLSWMPAFLYEKFHMSLAMSGLTATLFAQLASMVGSISGGWMADAWRSRSPRGRMLVQAIGVFGGAPFVALCGLTQSVTMLIVALTAWGFFKGLYDANIFASVFDVIRPEARGTAAGFMNTVGWLGGGGAAPAGDRDRRREPRTQRVYRARFHRLRSRWGICCLPARWHSPIATLRESRKPFKRMPPMYKFALAFTAALTLAAGEPHVIQQRHHLQRARAVRRMAGQSRHLDLGQRNPGGLQRRLLQVRQARSPSRTITTSPKCRRSRAAWMAARPGPSKLPPGLRPPAQGGELQDLKEPMDFTAPGFAFKAWFSGADTGPSWFWYSNDRGHSWLGPFRLPDFGQPGVAARTDYIVNGKRDAFLFLTAAKKNGKEGRVFCARTTDGGLHWKFVSWIGDEPAGFSIMPSSVRLSKTEIVTATRVKEDQENSRIDIYASTDNAQTWSLRSQAIGTGAFSGNPPSLVHLRDGRLAVTYGTRTAPFGIRARLSNDQGRTWSDEIVLRDDAAAWDNGYTRSAQRPDGNIVTVYYFPERPQTERIIAATIWDPGKK